MSPKLFNILIILISVVLYFLVVTPLYTGQSSVFFEPKNGVVSLRQSVDEYDAAIAQVDGFVRESKKMLTDYESFNPEVKKNVMTMIPESVEELRLLSEINSIAAERGVALDGLTVKEKGQGRYTITFAVKTTYQNFKEIIALYEKSMRLITLDSVGFNASGADNDIIKFNVGLSAYYLK